MTLDQCLPANLRGPATTITPIAAGLSGAGVYRVEAEGAVYALKLTDSAEPVDVWRRRLDVLRLAAAAGLAPRVVHVDEATRAVLSEFVSGASLPALLGDPRTRDAAFVQLAQTLRGVHALPIPGDAGPSDPRRFLADAWTALSSEPAVPPFVAHAARRALAEEPPHSGRPAVLSHNDVNPTNLVHDGQRLLLIDWHTAAPNDPFYDLAAISVFLRMNEASCRALLSAYDGTSVAELPARFVYDRRLVAVLCGAMFLRLALQNGYVAGAGAEAPESLGEFYQRLRAGTVSVASPEGQWAFGLALVREGGGQ